MTIPPITTITPAPDPAAQAAGGELKTVAGTADKHEPPTTENNETRKTDEVTNNENKDIPHAADARAELKPFTCGGEAGAGSLLLVELTDAHLKQKNLHLNEALWTVMPVHMRQSELREEFELWHKVANEYKDTGDPYAAAELAKAAPFVEESFLGAQLHALSLIHRALMQEGFSLPHPLQILGPRKTAAKVEPLSVVVKRALNEKLEGDKIYKSGFPAHAVKVYWFAIVNMYPWIATPLTFTPHVAFESGLAQVQATLWLRLAHAIRGRAQQLKKINAPAKHCNGFISSGIAITSISGTVSPHNWLPIAELCATLVVNTRFVRRPTLSRAYALCADLNDENGHSSSNSVQNNGEHHHDSAQLRAQHQRQLAQLILASDPQQINTNAWAHRECVSNHTGCGCGPAQLSQVAAAPVAPPGPAAAPAAAVATAVAVTAVAAAPSGTAAHAVAAANTAAPK